MSNLQERYIKEVKKDFIDRVKLELREKRTMSMARLARGLKAYLYATLEKAKSSDLLEDDQKAEIVNYAYGKLYPAIQKMAEGEKRKATLKEKYLRSSFLSGLSRRKKRAQAPAAAAAPNATMSNKSPNRLGMSNLMRALNSL